MRMSAVCNICDRKLSPKQQENRVENRTPVLTLLLLLQSTHTHIQSDSDQCVTFIHKHDGYVYSECVRIIDL